MHPVSAASTSGATSSWPSKRCARTCAAASSRRPCPPQRAVRYASIRDYAAVRYASIRGYVAT
eukprot:12528517-Alexandrium_andersonii.AAC.1